mgnify:CR=1 FL=1
MRNRLYTEKELIIMAEIGGTGYTLSPEDTREAICDYMNKWRGEFGSKEPFSTETIDLKFIYNKSQWGSRVIKIKVTP